MFLMVFLCSCIHHAAIAADDVNGFRIVKVYAKHFQALLYGIMSLLDIENVTNALLESLWLGHVIFRKGSGLNKFAWYISLFATLCVYVALIYFVT
jgi:hypothetical protein